MQHPLVFKLEPLLGSKGSNDGQLTTTSAARNISICYTELKSMR